MMQPPQDPSLLITALEWVWRIVTVLVIPALFVLVKQIFALRQTTALLDLRTCALEKHIENSPGNELTVNIAALNGEIKLLHQTMKGLTATVARHDDFLMSQGGRQ